MNDQDPAQPATPETPPMVPVVPASPVVTDIPTETHLGRYTRAELEAMRGKRGRKPLEYYQVFPRETTAAPRSPGVGRRKSLSATPRVSSAILGDQSIDDLLAKAGSRGSKPPAYHILVAAAEHLVAAGAVEAPVQDALAARVIEAPPKVRAMIEALLDATT